MCSVYQSRLCAVVSSTGARWTGKEGDIATRETIDDADQLGIRGSAQSQFKFQKYQT